MYSFIYILFLMSRSVEYYLLDMPGAIQINDPIRLGYERNGYVTSPHIIAYEQSQGRVRLESVLEDPDTSAMQTVAQSV